MLLTFWVCYWQWCQPVARLLKLLIIDELTCKSIMQTTTEACGKKTHEQTMIEMNTETHVLVWFCSLSSLFYESPVCRNMFICDLLWWFPQWFMAVYVCAPLEWSHQLYITDTTIKITHLRRVHALTQTHADHHRSGWEASEPPFIHDHSVGPLKLSWGEAHLRHTKNNGMNKNIYRALQPSHMQLDKTISTSAHRHTRVQAHSTFNDPILSTKWRYSQLHALNWHL